MATTGRGTTLDLSTGGVAFECLQDLPPGTPIVVKINWPVATSESLPLLLEITGTVVRKQNSVVAVKSSRHNFRSIESVWRELDAGFPAETPDSKAGSH